MNIGVFIKTCLIGLGVLLIEAFHLALVGFVALYLFDNAENLIVALSIFVAALGIPIVFWVAFFRSLSK